MPLNLYKQNYKLHLLIVLGIILFFFEIARIFNYCLTWDESLTYLYFVVPVFHNSVIEGLENLIHPISGSVANNHLLNTLLIGILDKITGIKYNEYIIRLPIFFCFIVYIGICIWMYVEKRISFLAASMLLLSYYVNEFFALARGYGMAVALVTVGIYYWMKWQDELLGEQLMLSIFFFSLAELANTITLLIIAPFYILTGLLIAKKKLWNYMREYPFKIFILAIINIFAVWYHFYISRTDDSLYCNREGSLIQMMQEYDALLMPSKDRIIMGACLLLFLLCILNMYWKRASLYKLRFTFLWVGYLVLTYICVKLTKAGFPTGRAIIPGYPLYILMICELVENVLSFIRDREKVRVIQNIVEISSFLLLLLSFMTQIDLKTTRDWSNSQYARKWTYQIYEEQRKVTEKDFEVYSESLRFYREQIRYRYGYDIFREGE